MSRAPPAKPLNVKAPSRPSAAASRPPIPPTSQKQQQPPSSASSGGGGGESSSKTKTPFPGYSQGPYQSGGIMAFLDPKDTGHSLERMLAPTQDLHKMFGREWYHWHQTLKICAQARVIGRSYKGGVRVTLDGLGRLATMSIEDSLNKDLDLLAAQVIDAVNDARQKMHDFKKFEWEKYMRRDLEPLLLQSAKKNNTEFDEFTDAKLRNPVDEFARVLDLDAEFDGVNSVMLPPYPYDDKVVDRYLLLEKYFEKLNLNMKECCEDFSHLPKYLKSKNLTWQQFESGWHEFVGEKPFYIENQRSPEENEALHSLYTAFVNRGTEEEVDEMDYQHRRRPQQDRRQRRQEEEEEEEEDGEELGEEEEEEFPQSSRRGPSSFSEDDSHSQRSEPSRRR